MAYLLSVPQRVGLKKIAPFKSYRSLIFLSVKRPTSKSQKTRVRKYLKITGNEAFYNAQPQPF
jgi:hypothetical protein